MKKLFVTIFMLFTAISLLGCTGTTVATTTTPFDTTKTITVYTRDTTSGTRDAFFTGIGFAEAILDNTVLLDAYVEVDGNGSMITAVQNDAYGIGYISLASLADSELNGLTFEGVEATEENVLNGTYTLSRPFNYIVRADWSQMDVQRQITEAFIAYMSTVDGKSTIKNHGGIVNIETTDSLWDDIKAQYPICSQDNSAVTVVFGGSTSVEGVAKALTAEFSGKCGNFIAEHNHTGSGDGYKRTQGSEATGANAIHIGFASRAFKSTEPAAVGTFGALCYDAVVIVVNGANDTLTALTAAEIKNIYLGEIALWSELA
jgi:phosphate transport system substrate-binding protein